MKFLVKEKGAADVEMSTVKDRLAALKDEVEHLRRQVQELESEKEVKIVQISKQRAQDMHGLNIALDSKQQELKLVSAVCLARCFVLTASCS
jgi:predicted  nucleic acid-binding Zn-ribbon protein